MKSKKEPSSPDLLFLLLLLLPCCSFLLANGEPSLCLPPNSTSLILDPPQDNYTINQIVALSCSSVNFTLIGPMQVTCSVGGQWDTRLPICVELMCPPPKSPRYGLAELEYFNDTDIRVAFSCLYKYTLIGVSQVACNSATGLWSDPPPKCYASCGSPPGVSFGKWQVVCMHENCTAEYICDPGHELKGSGKVVCLADGLWSDLTTYCQEITCQAPAITDFGRVVPDTHHDYANRYPIGTNATYNCFSNKYRLLGNETITCLGDGTWSSLPPICELAPTTTTTTTERPTFSSTTSTTISTTATTVRPTTSGPAPCPDPPALKFGSFRRYSRFIIYRCHHGYILLGNDERHCYDNGSWSGALPKCLEMTDAPATKKPYHWKQVFIDHSKWKGYYQYDDQTVAFSFAVQSVQLGPTPAVQGMFREGTIKFKLKGTEEKSGEIVFRMTEIFVPTSRFPSIDWATRGWLQEHPCIWTYTGSIETPLRGFQTFHMEAKRLDRLNSEDCKSSNSKSTEYIVVGVLLSILVVCVPVVALLWIRREKLIEGRGHRTLTSFENPVYEYENGLK